MHRAVLGKDVADNPADPFAACDLHQATEELRAESLVLITVTHYKREFRPITSVKFRQPAYSDDFGSTAQYLALYHKHHLTVVVDEADAGEPFVRYALAQAHHMEIPEVHAT